MGTKDSTLHPDLEFYRWEHYWRFHHRAHLLRLKLQLSNGQSITGASMSFAAHAGDAAVPVSVAAVDAAGNPAQATLSGVTFTSSDSSVVTFAADPNNPNGALMTFAGPGSVTITASATATEGDGTVHTVTGGDTVSVAAAAIPPADHLVIEYGQAAPAPAPAGGVNTAAFRMRVPQTLRR